MHPAKLYAYAITPGLVALIAFNAGAFGSQITHELTRAPTASEHFSAALRGVDPNVAALERIGEPKIGWFIVGGNLASILLIALGVVDAAWAHAQHNAAHKQHQQPG